jgi:hypothetical protein
MLLVLLSILNDYSNGYARARSLVSASEIKIMEEPSLIFTGLWFDTYVLFMRLSSKKYKIVSWKNKHFETYSLRSKGVDNFYFLRSEINIGDFVLT